MGITSFTLSGLGVDAAVSGVRGTVPWPQERVKGKSRDFGPGAGKSRLSGRNHQFLSDEEAIAIGEGVFFQDRILRYAEAGRDARERVPFAHHIELLLTGCGNGRRACGGGDNRERWSRRQGWLRRVFAARCQKQSHRKGETGDRDRARLISRSQNAMRPPTSDPDSSGHV
jgi:hypothetical protein